MTHDSRYYDVRCAVTNGAKNNAVFRMHVVTKPGDETGVGLHPPMLAIFDHAPIGARLTGTETKVATAMLPKSVVVFVVTVDDAGRTQEDRIEAALEYINSTSRSTLQTDEALIQNLHCYWLDLVAVFTRAAAAAEAAEASGENNSGGWNGNEDGEIIVVENVFPGSPLHRCPPNFVPARVEFTLVREGDMLYLVHAMVSGVHLVPNYTNLDRIIDESGMGSLIDPSMEPPPQLMTEEEFDAAIVPFSVHPQPTQAPVPTADALPTVKPKGSAIHILSSENTRIDAMAVQTFEDTGLAYDCVVDRWLEMKVHADDSDFMARNRDIYVCGTGLAQLLMRPVADHPEYTDEEVVKHRFTPEADLPFTTFYTHVDDAGKRQSLLLDRQFIFFPCNFYNKHWVLYLAWKPFSEDGGFILTFDSLPGMVRPFDNLQMQRRIKVFLMCVESEYSRSDPSTPLRASLCKSVNSPCIYQQPTRSNACGYFVAETIGCFLTSPEQRERDMAEMAAGRRPFAAHFDNINLRTWPGISKRLMNEIKERYEHDKTVCRWEDDD
jgi:hypothetical protein